MLGIVIVNYKNQIQTVSYIKKEIEKKVSIPHLIVIVNNSATTESNKQLVNELNGFLVEDINKKLRVKSNVYIVSHSDNLGFAKGNNLGSQFLINHFKIDYLLFSNNDIRLLSDRTIERLIDKLSTLPNIALIGPKVIGLQGENQSPEPNMSIQDRYIWMYWLTPFLKKEVKAKRFKLDYSKFAKEGIHYKVMGSFFIVKANDFINCGMMDSNTFLYAEEVILSERLNAINKYVYYYPEVEILHEHSQTISNHLSRKKMVLTKFKSESYYYKTYKGVSNIIIAIAKASVLLHLTLKGLKS